VNDEMLVFSDGIVTVIVSHIYSSSRYDAVYEDDLPGLLAVKTHFWDNGHPDVEVYLRRRTIDGDWVWLVTKAVSYVDQPIPGIILLEREVEDIQHASQINRIIRISAILVQAVEAAQVASLNTGLKDDLQGSDTGSLDSSSMIPWVAEDAAAYQAMLQHASGAPGAQLTTEDSLAQIMKAAATGGANSKRQTSSKLEQEIMERIGGKKKESFDPFSVLEEVREGVRLDLGMICLSEGEVKMITLVLKGEIPTEDLANLVYQALSSGYGLDVAVNEYLAYKAQIHLPLEIPEPNVPSIAVLNLSYTYMGNAALEVLSDFIQMEGSRLRTIDVSFCALDERGCTILAKALTKRKRNGIAPIRGLILSGNHITYKSATDLGRALCWEENNSQRRPKHSGRKKKVGGYDEDTSSDGSSSDDNGDDDMMASGPSKAKRSASMSDAAKKYLSKDHGLQVLHLGSAMKDADSVAQFLHGLGPSCPVKELSLTSNGIGADGVALLVDFLEGKGKPKGTKVMPYLDRLDLSNNKLGNDGLAKLTRAVAKRNGMHLVELRLSNNGIGHGGIETMMNKLLQHNLVSLSLDKNAIGDQGCQLVAASLNGMKSLSRLNLGFNQIGSRGVNSLMRSLVACDSIQYLSLSGNIMKISGAVALAFTLAQHPRLEELDVDNCCLSQAAQCHIIAGIIANRWVPMKRMNGFEAGPPMVALGALQISAQGLSNEECFRIRKDEQMKTILEWMKSNRNAKMAGARGATGSADSYQHFLTPDFVQSQNDVQGIPSQNAYLRLLGWLSRIPFDEDELISLRKYFYDSDGGSEDRGSDGYINLKLRGDLLAALESDVADEIRDDTPMFVQYQGSVGIDLDLVDEGVDPTVSAWDYMRGEYLDKAQRIRAESAPDSPTQDPYDNTYNDSMGDDMSDDEYGSGRKRRMDKGDSEDDDFDVDGRGGGFDTQNYPSSQGTMSNVSRRSSSRSFEHSESDRSNVSHDGDRKRKNGGLKARITMFPQFEMKLEELKATATEMIESEEDPEQQEIILTQYAEASLTILRQLRYHCMNSGLDGWRQGSMKRKVLVVDDSNVTRKLVSRAFEKANFIVDTATNGLEGVEKLKTSIYDIAFMDIDMPVMNGFEATKKLRQWEDAVRPGTRQPICALTAAYVDDFERSELMKFKEAGLDVMESKPCNIPRLFKVVDDVSPMFSDLSISVIQQERGGV
jgi:CheY-like chemotaxis protein/Ran GTPase-activating protein (RanGAP) involved in mRNA processing and transport